MAVQAIERPGPHVKTAGLRRDRGAACPGVRQAARLGPRGGEKAGAALVIIPSGRHCTDRQKAGRAGTYNPSFQSGAFFAIFFFLSALGRSLWERPSRQDIRAAGLFVRAVYCS